jgi:chitinase
VLFRSGVGGANNGLFQPNNGIFSQGVLDYREIAAKYVNSFTLYREPTSQAPWLYDSQQGVMISYDDAQSLKTKADYARKLGLGGMMIWQLAGDDLKNTLLNSLSQ